MDVAEAEEIYRKALDKRRKATKEANESLGESLDKIDELAESIKNLGSVIGGTAGDIISFVGDIMTFTTSVIDTVNNVKNILSGTAEGVSATMNAIETASAILAIISTAIQVVSKITSFFGADYSEYEELKSKYENLIDIWDDLIDKKKEYINMSYGAEVMRAEKEALSLIQKQVEAYRELGKARLNAGASAGSSSIGQRMAKGTTNQDWMEMANALGWTVAQTKDFIGEIRMTGLFDLTVEQLQSLKENAYTFWAKMDEDVRNYLQSIIDAGDATQETIESAQERLTGGSE